MIRYIAIATLAIAIFAGNGAAQSAAPRRKDIPAIAKSANGVIVSIITSNKDGKPVAQGTGFLVSTDGRIVTNYHVIKGASSAIVKLPDGAFYDVDGVAAFDKARDLAVIKAHGQNFRVVTLGNSDRVQVGEEIVAIGSPLSLESTVSSGIVSGIRTIEEEGGTFLQVTAPMSPGSSGGPVFDMEGEVVGITTLYLEGGENLNFAIPINDAKRLLSAGSKLQHFPVETEAAKRVDPLDGLGTPAVPAEPASPSTPLVGPNTALGYYKQLYNAGGFHFLNSNLKYRSFVCFNDNPSSQDFFTITAWVYDEQFAKAARVIMDASPDSAEAQNAAKTLASIESSAPYVNFVNPHAFAFLEPEMQTKLQQEGWMAVFLYRKGVMISQFEYRGFENSENSLVDKKVVEGEEVESDLSIEPTTLRYNESLEAENEVGSGSLLGSGMCGRIPAKRPN